MTALWKVKMDSWKFTAGKSVHKMVGVMLLFWSVLLNLHRRAKAKKNTSVEDGPDVRYESVSTKNREEIYTIPISEFQIKCSIINEESTEEPAQDIELVKIDQTKVSNETLPETETENEIEATEQEEPADINNNMFELDTRFTYSYDDDETSDDDHGGYDADSDDSDIDELSNSDVTYRNMGYWSDDEEISYSPPKRPMRIRPIRRQMPVSSGLRIAVLKQEARKALPIHFSTSRI